MLKAMIFPIAAALVMLGSPADAQMRVACPVGKTCTPYRVKAGDTLSEITRDVLGTARTWPEVYTENRRRFKTTKVHKRKSPHLIYPGQVIVFVR